MKGKSICKFSGGSSLIFTPSFYMEYYDAHEIRDKIEWLFEEMKEAIDKKDCGSMRVAVRNIMFNSWGNPRAATFIYLTTTPNNIYATVDRDGMKFSRRHELSSDTVWIGSDKCPYSSITIEDERIVYDIIGED